MGWTEQRGTLQSRTLDSRRPVLRGSRSSAQASVANSGVWQKKVSLLLSSGSAKACTGKRHCAMPPEAFLTEVLTLYLADRCVASPAFTGCFGSFT